jgi:predicted HD phosphohydrolase
MTEEEFEAYMKHEFTQEETAARVARMKAWDEELHQANLESPLPDDFIDYCKGRKFFRQAVA